MALLPRSLFSRLVLVLLGGLAVAQLLSFAIHMHERGELLLQASGVQSAQRVADIVKLLESSDPAGRQRIAKVLGAPPLRVSLDQPLIAPDPAAASQSARAVLFGAVIRRLLGDEWPVEAVIAEETPAPLARMHGPGMAAGGPMRGRFAGPAEGAGMHPAGPPNASFVAQVRLHDGTLVTFDARPPQQTASWPVRMLLSLVVLLAAVVALSLLAVRWATRPLKALADAADELGRDIHRPAMPEQGPVEVVRAARAFNTMQRRLAAYLRERTSVLAAMSHDLKTPVTRLRLRAELLQDPHLRLKFTQDLQELEGMVAATLEFLRGGDGTEAIQPVDMNALLESLRADLTETGSRVTIAGRALRPYDGQPVALKRCIRNLVENAVKYGECAAIEVQDDDRSLQILVRDEGPGIPPAQRERVFEPFYRMEGSRGRDTGGTGLGLTISKSIAESHGGSISLQDGARGGLEVRLALARTPR